MYFVRDTEYVAVTRKRSLSYYIKNEDSPLKTKNVEVEEKKRGGGREGEREKERGRNVMRSMGLPTEFTLRCILRRCGSHAANISRGWTGRVEGVDIQQRRM